MWLDPWDDAVRSAVVVGVWGGQPDSPEGYPEPFQGDLDLIELSLRNASDILSGLTAHAVHPHGRAVDRFTAWPGATRLALTQTPATRVLAIRSTHGPVDNRRYASAVLLHGGAIRFYGDGPLEGFYRANFGCQPRLADHLEVEYEFGSTVTASARAAVLRLAHEVYLLAMGDERCQLPERTTSVNREGLAYSLIDPQTYLDKGRTGIPAIDMWLVQVNPARAVRMGGVFTPTAPPGVNVSITEPWVRP